MTDEKGEGVPSSFEAALLELESIVGGLERGALGLEESIQAFERGMKLLAMLNTRLQDAEKRVKQLIEQEGSIVERPTRSAEDA